MNKKRTRETVYYVPAGENFQFLVGDRLVQIVWPIFVDHALKVRIFAPADFAIPGWDLT